MGASSGGMGRARQRSMTSRAGALPRMGPPVGRVEPVRSAAQLPSDAKASAMQVSNSRSIAAPPIPLCKRTPNARPTAR